MQVGKICLLTILLGLLTVAGYPSTDKDTNVKQQVQKHNFIVLLDLSDRLQATNQLQRDIELITNIFSFFKSSVKSNMFIKSLDEFKVIIAPQKDMPYDIKNLENELRINLEALKISQKKKAVDNFESNLKDRLTTLYSLATKGKSNSKDYFGADIWKYFNEDLKSDIADKGINHLFIITDGYIYFEDFKHTMQKGNRHSSCKFMSELRGNDWENKFNKNDYGIISTNQKYSNVEVMILEANPQDNFLNEYDLLQKIWYKWLGEMGIKKIEMYKISPLQKINEKISNFIKVASVVKPEPNKNTGNNPNPIINVNEKKIKEHKVFQGTFIGNLNGFTRQLIISEINQSSKFTYTINGLGDKERNKKGTINLEKNTISFETLGKGILSQKDGKYTITSTQNKWTFTKQN